MTQLSPKEIVTPPCRIAFPSLFKPKPRSKEAGARLTYQAAVLIPPTVDLKPFYSCLRAALVEKFGAEFKLPASKNPIHDCSEKPDLDGYEAGWHYINTSSNFAPQVIDQRKQEVLDEGLIFAGCWCRFHLSAFPWDHSTGGKGVSFSLNAVQLVREDVRIDGRKDAADLFDAIDVPGGEKGAAPSSDIGDLFG